MKKSIIFFALFLFTLFTETKSQRLYISGVDKLSKSPTIFKFIIVGKYVFGVGGDANGDGVFMTSLDDSMKIWRKMVNILREGDFIVTTKGYIVVSSGIGTYLSPDTGRTWYVNKNHGPFAMLPMKDGSFLAGGGWYDLIRVRTDISPNIGDEKYWEVLVDSSRYWGQNTVSFLYRTSTGRIIAYLLGVNDSKGGIWLSDDDARSWRRPYPNVDVGLGTLFRSMAEYNHILIGRAEDGTFISRDDGVTWDKLFGNAFYPPDGGESLYMSGWASVFASPSLGYLLGGEKLLWSWDLSNWEILFPDSNGISSVYGIVEIQPGEILVDARGGLYLLKMTVITSVPVEGETIPSFSLSQNYPNPFNPTTTIRFSLPKSSKAKLIVFDVLGKEVSTLVNGELEQGEHSIVFNAQNLPSGVYLYKLTAGDFVQTRKMLLLK